MRKSIKVEPKKRGRPATGKDPLVGLRLPPEMIVRLDAWADGQGLSRSEAIRRIIGNALNVAGAIKLDSKTGSAIRKGANKTKEMARRKK